MGFVNDLLDILPSGERGISLKMRLLFVTVISSCIGWWFYAKLGITSIGIPGDGTLFIGALIIPLFVFVTLALYAGGIIDGIDGLAGGVFGSAFMAYAGIAYFQNQIDLAAFCATLTGAILAFLWFNIPPARFWMTETGTMGLTMTLAVVAFMGTVSRHFPSSRSSLLLPLFQTSSKSSPSASAGRRSSASRRSITISRLLGGPPTR
jgi:phospho-N-acetylmuramoyl-pentapeptide-transferase